MPWNGDLKWAYYSSPLMTDEYEAFVERQITGGTKLSEMNLHLRPPQIPYERRYD
jgi:hypothetical protein